MSERAAWRDEWTALTPVERAFVTTYFVGVCAYPVLLFGGALAAVLSWNPGVHIALAGVTVKWFGDLGIGVAARIYGAVEMVPLAVLILGMNMAAFAWRIGVFLMLVGLTARLLGHLAFGVRTYRVVMARPCPSVTPLADDDDW